MKKQEKENNNEKEIRQKLYDLRRQSRERELVFLQAIVFYSVNHFNLMESAGMKRNFLKLPL
jgi:hypothetical protein